MNATHTTFTCRSALRHVSVMAAPVALIQGASRGLGLEFCKHVLKYKTTASVVATCRNPDGAADLRALVDQHPGRMTVVRLDVTREEDIREASELVKKSFGRLDLIVNSSAMLHPCGKGETSLRDVSAQVKRLRQHQTPFINVLTQVQNIVRLIIFIIILYCLSSWSH